MPLRAGTELPLKRRQTGSAEISWWSSATGVWLHQLSGPFVPVARHAAANHPAAVDLAQSDVIYFGKDVAFWNERAGLVAGGNPKGVVNGLSGAESFVALTIDSGKTFSETFASSRPILSLGVDGYPDAWVATGACTGGGCWVQLYRTVDGGKSWHLSQTMTRVPAGFLAGGFGWAITPSPSSAVPPRWH